MGLIGHVTCTEKMRTFAELCSEISEKEIVLENCAYMTA
jgi:hypothetical protein